MYSTTLLMTGRHDGHMWIQSINGGKRKQTLLVARKVNVYIHV